MKNIIISILVFVLGFVCTSLLIAAIKMPNLKEVVGPLALEVIPGSHFRQCVGGQCFCHKYNGATSTKHLYKIYYELHTKWEPVDCRAEDDKYFMASSTNL